MCVCVQEWMVLQGDVVKPDPPPGLAGEENSRKTRERGGREEWRGRGRKREEERGREREEERGREEEREKNGLFVTESRPRPLLTSLPDRWTYR